MGWLNHDRYKELFHPEGPPTRVNFGGALRGVSEICLVRLKKALEECTVLPLDAERRQYAVFSEGRKSNPMDPEFVDLGDPRTDSCHCEDFIMRCDGPVDWGFLATPCKHMLAALVFEQDEMVMPFVALLQRRDAIAAAMTKPTRET